MKTYSTAAAVRSPKAAPPSARPGGPARARLGRTPPLRLLTLVAAVTLSASGLSGQVVRGTLVEETTNQPVSGAVVRLLDADGEVATSTLSSSSGRFQLTAPRPGAYRIRAERIGFATAHSPLLLLEGPEPIDYRMVARNEPVVLTGVEVAVRSRSCQVRPGDGAAVYQVWNEARKALEATALSQEESSLWMRRFHYEREYGVNGSTLRSERVWSVAGRSEVPFATLEAWDLARDGYIRQAGDTLRYYGPDAHVLLSDEFLDTHCFRVTTREERGRELVGLEFEPVATQRAPDIEGVLWLDRETTELRYVEYRYTRLAVEGAQRFGGRIDLERTQTGAWIVRKWSIRMPLTAPGTSVGPTGIARQVTRVVGIKEDGGEVVEISYTGRSPDAPMGALTGTVWDPLLDSPLAGASVYLSGTSHSVEADEAGAFRFEELSPGRYRAAFIHPVLDSIGAYPQPREVEIGAGVEEHIELTPPEGYVAIIGQVVDGDGDPVASAEVRLDGEPGRVETTRDGRFRLFGVTPGEHALEVRYPGLGGQRLEVRVADGSPALVTVTLDIRPIDLAPVTAVARIDQRRSDGVGAHVITAEQIARVRPTRFSDLMRTVPGVSIGRGRSGGETIETTTGQQRMTSLDPNLDGVVRDSRRTVAEDADGAMQQPAAGDGWRQSMEQPDPTTIRATGPCPMLVFVDGIPVLVEDTAHLLGEIPPASIDVIHVYVRAAMVPIQFRRQGHECGVVAIWTRRG